jgi:thioredoxin reductase (NADPH)
MNDLIIIGTGPAGLTAAIYAARAGLKPLLFEGLQPGGQLTITTEVENFPGYPKGILGPELMDLMREQALRFGAELVPDVVDEVDLSARPFKLLSGGQEYLARTVIIATGATARWLNIPSETRLRGRGVSACATCDGFFFRDKQVMVVGGGDSALEEAMFLTRFASKVTLVHRRDRLRASKAMQDRAFANPKLEFLWNSEIAELKGDKKLESVVTRNVLDGTLTTVPAEGFFLGIGHVPATEIFKGQVTLDEEGYIVLSKHTMTNIPGVFAAGDVVDKRYRQAISAAGMGCQAAIDAERFLGGE